MPDVNHCSFLLWIDKSVCVRGVEVIPVLMTKVKDAEMGAKTKKAKAKITKEIIAAKMAFNEEMTITLGDKNVKLEVMNHRLSGGLMVISGLLVCFLLLDCLLVD